MIQKARLLPCLAVCALFMTSCRDKLTEVLVVVSNEGLEVGSDIDELEIKITEASGIVTHKERVQLCDGRPLSPGAVCYTLPLTVLLVPGGDRPADPVDIEVDALFKGKTVIADAAVFRFTKHARLRLDLVLYLECLNNVSCAEQRQACVKNGMCQAVEPTPLDPNGLPSKPDLLGGTSDLASLPHDLAGADLAGPDLAISDLASVDESANDFAGQMVDLTPPVIDMTMDFTFPLDLHTTNDSMSSLDQSTLTDMTLTDMFDCTQCPANTICVAAAMMCLDCGRSSQPCCEGSSCLTGLQCNGATCEPVDMGCGTLGAPCCTSSTQCDVPYVCLPGSTCGMGSGSGSMSIGGFDFTTLPDDGISLTILPGDATRP